MQHLSLQELTNQQLKQQAEIKFLFRGNLHLYFIMEELENFEKLNQISVTGYSLGGDFTVFWGFINTKTLEWNLRGNCKYHPNELNTILNTWRENGLVHAIVFNERKTKRYDVSEDLHGRILLSLYEKGEIPTEFQRMVNNIHPGIKQRFYDKYNRIIDPTEKYLFLIQEETSIFPKLSPKEEEVTFLHPQYENYNQSIDPTEEYLFLPEETFIFPNLSLKGGGVSFLHPQYEKYKAILAFLNGKITRAQFLRLYPAQTLDTLNILFSYMYPGKSYDDAKEKLEFEVTTYEGLVHLPQPAKELPGYLQMLVYELSRRVFFSALEEGTLNLSSDVKCLNKQDCYYNRNNPLCEMYTFPRESLL